MCFYLCPLNISQKLSETEHIMSDEEVSAIERNKFEKDKNRTGADVPGTL